MSKLYTCFIICFIFLLDQISKAIVIFYFGGNFFSSFVTKQSYFIEKFITPCFNLVYVWNNGISFGLFNKNMFLVHILIIFISFFLILFLFLWIYRTSNTLYFIAGSMVCGGALGNFIDRIHFHAVFDFLDFHIGLHHWPAFNIADVFITLGALIILIQSLYMKK